MAQVYSDSFSGSGALGSTEIGAKPYTTSGVWTRSGGRAVTSTSATSNPHATIETNWRDVDITLNVGPGSGDGAYFRRTDPLDWCRARVDMQTVTWTTPYSYVEHQHSALYRSYTSQEYFRIDYWPSGGPLSPGVYPWYLDPSGDYEYPDITRTVTGTTTSSATYHYVFLERSVAGIIQQIGQFNNSTTPITQLRLIARGATLQVSCNGGTLQSFNDTQPLSGTQHGFGRAPSSGAASNLDNFSLTVLSNPPNSPILLTPSSGAVIPTTQTIRLSWQFSDDDPGDSQSHALAEWRIGTGSWHQTQVPGGINYLDIQPGQITNGQTAGWRVTTWDQSGQVSPASAERFFTVANPPAGPVWVSPPADSNWNNPQGFTWSSSDQTAFELRRVADDGNGNPLPSTIYGTLVGDAASRTASLTLETNHRTEHVQIRAKGANGLWSDWIDLRGRVEWTPPPIPLLTETADQFNKAIQVQISNPQPGISEPIVVSNRVVRTAASEPSKSWDGVQLNGLFIDWTPTHGVPYQYEIIALGVNGTTRSSNSPQPPSGGGGGSDPWAAWNNW